MKRLLLLMLIMQGLMLSCSVKQQMELNVDSSGNVNLFVEIHPIFRDYLLEISDVLTDTPVQQANAIFDLNRIQDFISARRGLKLNSIISPANNVLNMQVTFTDVEAVLNDEEMEDILTFSKNGGVNTLDFHLTASNFRALFAIAAMDDSPLIDTFGPSEIAPWNQEEYLENVSYALEENATIPEIQKMFTEASIEVRVNVNGEIISQKGGTVSGNAVLFNIPLLRVLTLVTPLDLQVVYK